jgi:hypothetical protein
MKRWARWLLALSALVPVVSVLAGNPPDPILMHTLFVLAYFSRNRLTIPTRPTRFFLRFLGWTVICGLLLETFAWLSNYIERNPNPALFHPQLLPDLLIAIGIYAAWGVAWWLGLRRFRFTLPAVYIVTGLYGVLIEQSGAVFQMGLATFPIGIIFWLYVFVAYGATMALAFLPFRHLFTAENNRWYKYVVMFIAIFACTFAIFYVWNAFLDALQVIPPKRPIGESPLW